MCIFGALFIQGISYIYKCLDIIVYSYDGKGLKFLNLIYGIAKNMSNGVTIILIISIAWGWSITHLKHNKQYLKVGYITAVINVLTFIIVIYSDEG